MSLVTNPRAWVSGLLSGLAALSAPADLCGQPAADWPGPPRPGAPGSVRPMPGPPVPGPPVVGPGARGNFYRQEERGYTPSIRDYSWTYIDLPEPREILVHDIVTILVDEKSEVVLNSRFDRTRNNRFKSELKEFVRIGEDGNLENAALNQPTIELDQQARIQSSGRALDEEGIRYRIAATVSDVLPNGNLVLEARKSIRTDGDLWEYTLTGILRPKDVLPNNTALSENVANLNIVKNQRGKIYGSTKRNWGTALMDLLWPF